MSLNFYYYNLAQQSATVLAASETNAFFPVNNIKDARRTKVYRSNTGACNVVFDFITIEEVDSIVLIPHTILGFGINTPITVEANATNTWGSPAFSTTITSSELDTAHEIAIKNISPSQSYRFWRLSFTGTGFCEVGKVFFGLKHILGQGRSVDYGWSYQDSSNSIITLNRYGQRFVDEFNRQKKFSFTLSNLSKTEVDDFFEIYDYNGITRPFFIQLGCDTIINNTNRFAGYVYFDDIPAVINTFHARYTIQLSLSEAT